jgi:hypothetical protein
MIKIIIIGGFTIASTLLGAGIAYWWTTKRERISVTMDLFRSFYAPEMHAARIEGAQYLLNSNESDTFDTLWKDECKAPVYQALTRVVYFWFGLSKLAQREMLDKDLAKGLFKYPFKYWKPILKKLSEDTVAEGSAEQDWLQIIENNELEWLLE